MPTADQLRAAVSVAELEEELIAAKATPAGPGRELKDRLRAARKAYRELRDQGVML